MQSIGLSRPSVLFGVFATRAQGILVTGCLRQAIGLGSITLEDFSLTGQIPTLSRPWVRRRVADRGGGRPSRSPNIGLRTVKAVCFAPFVSFLHRIIPHKSRRGHANRSGEWSAEIVPNHIDGGFLAFSAVRPEILRVGEMNASIERRASPAISGHRELASYQSPHKRWVAAAAVRACRLMLAPA
jgi:hypothetical protein